MHAVGNDYGSGRSKLRFPGGLTDIAVIMKPGRSEYRRPERELPRKTGGADLPWPGQKREAPQPRRPARVAARFAHDADIQKWPSARFCWHFSSACIRDCASSALRRLPRPQFQIGLDPEKHQTDVEIVKRFDSVKGFAASN